MFDDQMVANLPVPHEDGSFISAKVSRIAEMVREYDSNVDVRWIRPADRAPNEPAFALVSKQANGLEYVIMYVQDESEFDERVLARLYQMDAEKHGNAMSAIDAHNAAVKAQQERAYREQMEEATDMAYHILRSKKHAYKHDGVTYT